VRGIVRCNVIIYTDFSDIFQSFPCGLDTAVADVSPAFRDQITHSDSQCCDHRKSVVIIIVL
jgi:hypothetical protein